VANIYNSSPSVLTRSWQHMTYKCSKLGQTDPVFGFRSEFISRSMRVAYKSLSLAVMICTTLVNTQTDTRIHSFCHAILLA